MAGENNFLTGTYGGEAVDVYSSAVKGFSARMTEAQAEDLSEDPRVSYIEEDAVVRGAATQNGAPWHLDRVDQRAAPDGAERADAGRDLRVLDPKLLGFSDHWREVHA